MAAGATVLQRRNDPRGYTLVELSIVLALSGLLVTLAFPLWQGYIRDRRVTQAAEQIAGVMRFAQQTAVANSVDACLYRVVVSSTLARAEARSLARDSATGICTSPEVLTTVRVTDRFPIGVSAADSTVEFTSAGRLNGNTPVSINVSAGDRVRFVHVEPDTGKVEVSVTP